LRERTQPIQNPDRTRDDLTGLDNLGQGNYVVANIVRLGTTIYLLLQLRDLSNLIVSPREVLRLVVQSVLSTELVGCRLNTPLLIPIFSNGAGEARDFAFSRRCTAMTTELSAQRPRWSWAPPLARANDVRVASDVLFCTSGHDLSAQVPNTVAENPPKVE
jgi:hypothetical protein